MSIVIKDICAKLVRCGAAPALKSARVRRSVRKLRTKSVAIVMYHGVLRHPPPVFDWCQLGSAQFEEQIAFLSHEYRIVPLSEALDRLSKGRSFGGLCCITFDDGFRSFYTTAYPILKRYQAPASVFIVTSLPETRQPPWPEQLYTWIAASRLSSVFANGNNWPLRTLEQRSAAYKGIKAGLKALYVDEKDRALAKLQAALGVSLEVPSDSHLALMDWNEIEQLARTGDVSFGSHSHTHQILSCCSLERQREELQVSRNVLRDHVGVADTFAYPNGGRADFTSNTKHLLVELGYRCALATIPGLNSRKADFFELRRVRIGADTTFSKFERRMLGW
jgi:peptidoglycan/xylan/chitin deacetylase (PgdA/CDA1 family)